MEAEAHPFAALRLMDDCSYRIHGRTGTRGWHTRRRARIMPPDGATCGFTSPRCVNCNNTIC
jgi:hypothetical protein